MNRSSNPDGLSPCSDNSTGAEARLPFSNNWFSKVNACLTDRRPATRGIAALDIKLVRTSLGMNLFKIITIATIASLSATSQGRSDTEIFVETWGSDSNPGTEKEPFCTIRAAQNKIRWIKTQPDFDDARIHVHLGPGRYILDESIQLTEEDSGTEGNPIHYVGAANGATVLCGGIDLDVSLIQSVNGVPNIPDHRRPKIKAIQLPPSISPGSDGPHHELFIDGRRMTVARWPNQGWARMASKTLDGRSRLSPLDTLQLHESDINALLHVFPSGDWKDRYLPTEIHAESAGHHFTFADKLSGKLLEGTRFRICNLLSQLDSPGEYFLDYTNNRLYFWDDAPLASREIRLSSVGTALSLYDASHLNFSNLTIQTARNCGIEIVGGENVVFDRCVIKNIGGLAINLYHGKQHSILKCKVTNCGGGGIRVEGGNRYDWTKCEHTIVDCDISNFAQTQLCDRPGINIFGLGVRVLNNHIHDGPHTGIHIHGNEHLIQQNELDHLCLETADSGAIYLGHNPTYQGNRIIENWIHDVGEYNRTDVFGVYLDDFASGTTVHSNLFENAGRAIGIGGGRDNSIEENIIVNCLAAVQIDSRGTSWRAASLHSYNSKYIQCVAQGLEDFPLLQDRYPTLKECLDAEAWKPLGNKVHGNLYDSPVGIDLQDTESQRVVSVVENSHGTFAIARRDQAMFISKTSKEGDHTRQRLIDLTKIGPQKEELKTIPVLVGNTLAPSR